MKSKLLALASVAAMFAACSDTSVSDGNDQIKDRADVVVTTFDNLTRLPLKDVAVYSRLDDETKMTDSTGTIVWEDVALSDDFYLDFQVDGYAFKRVQVAVNNEKMTNDVARLADVHEYVEMYELGVDIKGQFFYKDVKTGNLKPAANVTIYATYADPDIYPDEVSVTTDENGFYTFSNMASNIGIALSSERFTLEDGTVYEAVTSFATVNERKGVSKDVNANNAVPAGNAPILLSTNLLNIAKDASIKLTFSEELEKDSVKTWYIGVANSSNNSVATIVSLDKDGKTVIIKPASGSWIEGNTYTVYFDVWTKAGALEVNDPTGYREFIVGKQKIPDQVKNLQLDTTEIAGVKQDVLVDFYGEYNYAVLHDEYTNNDTINYDATITVIWDKIEKGIDGYGVYVKGNSEKFSDFVWYDDLPASANKATIVMNKFLYDDGTGYPSAYPNYPFSKDEPTKIEIMILPYNNVGEALVSKTKITVDVKSKVEAQMKKYTSAALKTFNKPELYEGYYCTSENTSSCYSAYDPADVLSDTHFAVDFYLSWSWDDKDDLQPDGYMIYFHNAETDEWEYVDYEESAYPYHYLSWPYDNAWKVGKASDNFEVAVLPFFFDARGSYYDSKISAIEIDTKSKNYMVDTYKNLIK